MGIVDFQVDGRNGVKTTVVCPYFVKTPLFHDIDTKYVLILKNQFKCYVIAMILKSRTFSVLQPEDVARETINAILTNEPICIIPRFQTYFMMLKA